MADVDVVGLQVIDEPDASPRRPSKSRARFPMEPCVNGLGSVWNFVTTYALRPPDVPWPGVGVTSRENCAVLSALKRTQGATFLPRAPRGCLAAAGLSGRSFLSASSPRALSSGTGGWW